MRLPAPLQITALIVLCAGTVPVEATASQPNILFFFADDQRNDTLGCAGHPIIKTPAIDRLAADGVRFENAFVTTSICWVSRSSILTGLTARSFGKKNQPDAVKPEALEALYPDQLQNFVHADEYAQVLLQMRARCDELVNGYGGKLVPLSERVRKPRAKPRQKK